MKPEALQRRIREVVQHRMPKGWYLVERRAKNGADGLSNNNSKTIYVPLLVDLEALFCFLHEVGHVYCDHFHPDADHEPAWQHEYEAEKWAIEAMRAEGFSVSRAMMEHARENVRHRIGEAIARKDFDTKDAEFDPAALKFAFPKGVWRRYL